jgi:DNA-binding response OmpR family regulator
MRVLVIDDEPDVLMLCRVNLQLAGHEVIEANNGEAGLELALRERPDVVVLDVMLPKMDGISVLGTLANGAQTRDRALPPAGEGARATGRLSSSGRAVRPQ